MALFNTTPVGGIDFTTAFSVSSTTPEYPGPPIAVGTVVDGSSGSRWVLTKLETSATCTAGDVLIITTNSTWESQALTNTLGRDKLGQLVGVAGATGTAGQYVWMQIAGYVASVNAATSSSAFTVLHSAATAGRLNSGAGVGTTVAVNGIVLTATAASNAGPAILTNPVIGAND